jgi:hypothetical protein
LAKRWTLLEYDSGVKLLESIEDREKRVLFYPAVGQMRAGQLVDIEIAVGDMNVLFPMKALVIARRTRPRGTSNPRGVYLEIIEEDSGRFVRLCEFADGSWQPGTRRSSPRLRSELPAKYFYAKQFHDGVILDISVEGLFLRSDGPLPQVGEGLYIRIRTTKLWFPISLSTRVCWIDSVDTRRGMGLYCFGPPRGLKRLAVFATRLRSRVSI